ncbi:hypothetical protein IE53DRAFT_359272 [Violaceomyces palustris]|uniref:Uncharacterized protein n=1 Tax=Violaceomyces palustris TaxID=1673888 RepID=A0ACD0P8S0_9BASI|nr:hypothetical protein IE53DRAFT_359272 [Violaceomyces palustris]
MASRTFTVAPYGTWDSPITADIMIGKNIFFGDLMVYTPRGGGSNHIAYVENRPSEKGRAALVSIDPDFDLNQNQEEISNPSLNVRTAVHEYGGGAIAATVDGDLLFTDYNPSSFNVYRHSKGRKLEVVTPENPAHRFGDLEPHPTNANLFLSVLEDHTVDKPDKVVNSLVHTILQGRVPADQDTDPSQEDAGSGYDFYTYPRFSSDGRFIAWVCWRHPSMPFWGTELWVARFVAEAGSPPRIVDPRPVGGTEGNEVLQQPVWSIPEDHQAHSTLFFTSDRTGFANIYKVDLEVSEDERIPFSVSKPLPVLSDKAAIDFQPPCWTLNNSSYVPLDSRRLLVTFSSGAVEAMGIVELDSSKLVKLRSSFVSMSQVRRLTENRIVLIGTREDEPSAIVSIDIEGIESDGPVIDESRIKVLKRSSNVILDGIIDKTWLSRGREIEFPTVLPDGTRSSSHAVLYPPRNPSYSGPAGTSPPCIVTAHGGPTSGESCGFSLSTQFWTSRGWAVCAVNYGGSTGYGREFIQRLDGNWGVVDVRDCVAAAEFLGSSKGARYHGDPATGKEAGLQGGGDTNRKIPVLVERTLANGGVEFSLRNTQPAWGILDLLILTALLAILALSYLVSPSAKWFGAVAGLTWAWSKLTRVDCETVKAIPCVGIQLETVRGLRLPWPLHSAGKDQVLIKTSKSQKLVSRDSILDLFVNETFQRWQVVDYLALATSHKENARLDVERKPTERIEILFPNLLPRLALIQRIYRKIYPVMFGRESSNRVTESRESELPIVDRDAIVITGGSSGGFTVLSVLCLFPDTFKAGISRYGICDLTMLTQDSHKFESNYCSRLVGGDPKEVPELYKRRSPIYMADRIRAPILIQQGSADKVVPPNQSQKIVDAVKKNHGQVEYLLFEGEGHDPFDPGPSNPRVFG